jgi:hypothetical protein
MGNRITDMELIQADELTEDAVVPVVDNDTNYRVVLTEILEPYPTASVLASSDGAARIGKAGGGNVQDALDKLTWLTPEQFGAVGDGVTDDQAAFDLLNAELATNGGFVQLGHNKTYIGGRQISGGTYYREGVSIIKCTTPGAKLIVNMNGATLKFKSGLKFGSFDAATGLPKGAASFLDSEAADLAFAILGEDLDLMVVYGGGEMDGNISGMTVGGEWHAPSDSGRQLAHYGLGAIDCETVIWRDFPYIHDFGLDGWLYAYAGLGEESDPKPFRFKTRVDRVGRNCASLTGCNDVRGTPIHSRAGEAINAGVPGGEFGTAPASCLDIEAEGSICRNIELAGGKLISGAASNTALVADSGDSAKITVEGTQIVGNIYINGKKRVIFDKIEHNGICGALGGGHDDPADNTLFIDCKLSDEPLFEDEAPTMGALMVDTNGAGAGVRFVRGSITARYSKLSLANAKLERTAIILRQGTDAVANQDFVIVGTGGDWNEVQVIDEIPTSGGTEPADGYYITAPAIARNGTKITPGAEYKVKWYNWSPGAGGFPHGTRTDGTLDTAQLSGSKTFDPGSIADGSVETTTVTVADAALGDLAIASFSLSTQGIILNAWVSAADTVSVAFQNETGADVDLASGTLRARVLKA